MWGEKITLRPLTREERAQMREIRRRSSRPMPVEPTKENFPIDKLVANYQRKEEPILLKTPKPKYGVRGRLICPTDTAEMQAREAEIYKDKL